MTPKFYRKGIVLAGGSGTRLYPLTLATSKQLLPIYDKPMVYYPVSVLMRAGIRDILVISTPTEIGCYQRLFGDGSRLGMSIHYAVQARPEGLAQAFTIGRGFIGGDHCALVLGDNLLHGPCLTETVRSAAARTDGATIFGFRVDEPTQFGVVEVDAFGNALSIEEKPARPRSQYAVPGLYFYDNDVLGIAAGLRPSPRGELEITDVNRAYMASGKLHVEILGPEFTWFDAGTPDSLLRASQLVREMEVRDGRKIGCIEELAYREGFIDAVQLERLAFSMRHDYRNYLLSVLRGENTATSSFEPAQAAA